MPKVRNQVASRKRRKRIIKQAKGYFGNKSRLFTYAKDAVWRAGKFAYIHRRKRKTEFRQLWIIRINAACRELGIPYSRLIAGLNAAHIEIDRKALSELAIHDAPAFKAIVDQARAALDQKTAA